VPCYGYLLTVLQELPKVCKDGNIASGVLVSTSLCFIPFAIAIAPEVAPHTGEGPRPYCLENAVGYGLRVLEKTVSNIGY
jgi:hypothetical protein